MDKNLIRQLSIGLFVAFFSVLLGLNVQAADPVFKPEAGKPVHYNWGFGSPSLGIPADHFTAVFDQSKYYWGGNYFLQTFADDGVKVTVDGNLLINRWSDYTGKPDRSLWLGVKSGQHTVKTNYFENVGGAAVFSDIVPLDSWLAYYYPNETLSGMPKAAKVIAPSGGLKKLYQDFASGSPATGIGTDHFSARYTTAKRIPAGEYILRAKADDGIRVYVDGKQVVNRWTGSTFREDSVKINITDRTDAKLGEKDVHWIDVEYFDSVSVGKVEFFLEPFQSAIDNAWVGEVYPNKYLQGTPYVIGGANSISPISKIDFNWGSGKPLSTVPADGFSARFTKKVYLEAGTYRFTSNGDNGVRVKLDGKTINTAWPNTGFQEQKQVLYVGAGKHTIVVEYFEDVGLANLKFNYLRYTQLPVTVGKIVHKNWGWGSPGTGLPSDYFTGTFDQSGTYSSGDYFIQSFADDGVKVQVDGQWPINRFGDYNGKVDRALWLGVIGGQHTVKTQYLENVAGAAVFSDIVPLDSWLAYYYPNETLSGMPKAAKVIPPSGSLKKLSQDFNTGSPAQGIGTDHFSARYTTAKRIPAGEYILRAKADDGIRIYVDGKRVINRWTSGSFREDSVKINITDRLDAKTGEQGVHWIEVEYFDSLSVGKVEFFLEPFQKAVENTWVGEVYPNTLLQGTPYIVGGANSLSPISKLDFNWGSGKPLSSVPADNFSARFTKSVNLDAGTYLFTTKADDGVRVKVDGKTIIDAWSNAINHGKMAPLYISAGKHTINVEYIEGIGNASLSFNYEKVSANQIFYQTTNQVGYNWGQGSPDSFPTDGFEAVFDQSQSFKAGDYFLQTFADDGVKVNVDNQWLINRWSDYSGSVDRALLLGLREGRHSIRTHYYENVAQAAVFSNVVPFDTWLAYYYPNQTLSGMPLASKIIEPVGITKNLYEDHQDISPAPGIDKDHFSVRYTTAKRIPAGEYYFRTKADDGVRVYLDGQLVLNRWTDGALREDEVKLNISNRIGANVGEQDVHWIEVEYYDSVSVGKIEFSAEPVPQGPFYLATSYGSTLSQAVDIQMTKAPQTDLYTKFLREDALAKDADGNWIVNGSGWNVRGGPGTTYPIVGSINNGTKVSILNTIKIEGQLTWYQVSAWINPLRSDVEYYLNPANFTKASTQYFQFLKLSESAGLNIDEVNQKILVGKGILQGKASSFIQAGAIYGINEVYLISHALLETGNGTSLLANGVLVSKVDGLDVEPKIVYNMYGINAKDSCPVLCGSEYAYKMGWTTPEKSIVGGAEFIANKYINQGQDTLYKMRWNPSAPGTHQYATDIGWAVKQVNRIKGLYDLLSYYTLTFDEPVYK